MVQHRNSKRFITPWIIFCTALLVTGSLIPMLVRSETTLQIRATRHGETLPDGFYLWQILNARGISFKSITPTRDSLVIHFDSTEQSLAAQKVLRLNQPYRFDVAQVRPNKSSKQATSTLWDPIDR